MKLKWWHIHKWSIWTTYSVKVVNLDGLARVELRQRRHCTECGYTQDEKVAYTNNLEDLK